MLTRTLCSFVAVAGVAVAGCATELTEPLALQGGVRCPEVAELTGLDLGNHEVAIERPVAGHYQLDTGNPEAFALAPADWGTRAPWTPELASAPSVSLTPAEWGTHLEWAAELGVTAIVVDYGTAAVAHVVDPSVTGWDLALEANPRPQRVRPRSLLFCLDR